MLLESHLECHIPFCVTLQHTYSVVDQRGQAGLPLIITTNLSLAEIKDASDMSLRRIYDRLETLCPITICMDGTSRRTADAARRKQAARELLL